jgi:hypothetical protein
MLKPLIATKAINPISRGLFTAAKNSVGRVKESTQQITKGLNKDQKFPMNYVEFFGSKKTVKILRKNLKSVRDSLTSTFGFVSTLTKTVGGLFKKLGPGGLFGSLVGTIGATIFGGIFGKVLLVTLATLALGGIGALLVKNAPEFFKFLRSNIANLRPIVEEIVGDFALGRLTKPGDLEQARILDEDVSLRAERILENDPNKDDPKLAKTPDVAYKEALNETITVINKDIVTLEQEKVKAIKEGKPTDEIDGAIAALKRDKNYLKTGKIASKDPKDVVTRTMFRRMFDIDPQPGTGFTGYGGMSKEQRLDRLNQIMRDNDLAKLKFEAMRSGSFANDASEDRLKFNLDLLNAIKAKENKQEFSVDDLQSDALRDKTLIDANKAILKQFNETYLKINQSPNKQSNVNIINKSGSGNKRGSGVNSGEKIVGDGAEGGTLSMKFLSALNEDLAMERSLSKSVLSVYM